ncbi:MAG TPA: formylmethanofuran dehydrogenase subunit B [Thermoleophilia bacterium]|nr:formylmethanofuran dehydrogenase subunit B [Thermoleophilia bacterium]HQG03557.1 formylmethanofuran dehydrogenase subunit B [Thermoleophilia bacterium]
MSTVLEHVACPFCGCVCDDIAVEVDGGRVLKVKRACTSGQGVFMEYDPSPRLPRVRGAEVDWDVAVAEAAAILDASDSPLIYGLSSSASEAQRKAVALADRLGAVIDSTSSVCHGPTGLAMQAVGEPTCTLGEVRDRADVLVFWGCNPDQSHLRHLARYSANARGALTPNGRGDRTVYVVDVRETGTAKKADHFLQVAPGCDYEVLTTLRLLVQGGEPDVDVVGGIPVADLTELVERLKACRYGVFFMGMGLTMTAARQLNVAELFTLVAELNAFARCSVIPMRGHGNVTGADQVLTWTSGYPFAVSYARGYPQFSPGEFSAVDMLARRAADAALILASDPGAHFPRAAAAVLEEIPTIVLDHGPSVTAGHATVLFPTAAYGVDAAGTAYRMDNVPIPLSQVIETGRPTDEDILGRLIEAVRP